MESLSALAMVALGVLLLTAAGTPTPRKTQQVAYSSDRIEDYPRRVVLIPDEDEEYPYGSGPGFRSAAPVRLTKPPTAAQMSAAEKANKEKGWIDNLLQQASNSGLNIPNYTPSTTTAAPPPQTNTLVNHVIHLADGSTFDVNTGELKPSKLASPPVRPTPQQDSVPIIIVGVPVPATSGQKPPPLPSRPIYAPAYPSRYPPSPNYPPSYPPSFPSQTSYPPNFPPPSNTQYAPNYQGYVQTFPQSTYAPNYQNYAPSAPQNGYAPNYPAYPQTPAAPYGSGYATPGAPKQWPQYGPSPYGYYPPPNWHQPPNMPYSPFAWPPYRPTFRPPNKGPNGWYGSYYGYRPFGGPGAYIDMDESSGPLEGYGKPVNHNHRPSYRPPYRPPYNPYWHPHGHDDEDDDDDDDDHLERHRHPEYSHYPNDYHYPYDYKTKQKMGGNRNGLTRPQRKPEVEEQQVEPEVEADELHEVY